jgi:hypothetical protein
MTDPDPPPDADPRPWDQPGAVRRDVAPHRGNVLVLLAEVALAVGASSFCLVWTGPVAVVLGWVVHGLARRDLGKRWAGAVDPRGRAQALRARQPSDLACGVGGVGTLCGLVGWACLLPHQ